MSFRTDLRAGVLSTLDAFVTANPTLLRGVYKARPASINIGELPRAWIDSINAVQITHGNSIRQQRLEAIVTLAVRSPDSEEQADQFDDLIDGLMDAFTADFHSAGGRAITEQVGYSERPIDEGSEAYSAVDFTVQAYIAEGRQ